jgi:hypothetical protein
MRNACVKKSVAEGGTDRLPRNVGNYQSSPRNITQARRSHLHRGRQLEISYLSSKMYKDIQSIAKVT